MGGPAATDEAGVLATRKPPQNLEAERTVLGSMLIDPDATPRVVEKLKGQHFYTEAHQLIFAAFMECFEASLPLDLLTVTEKLRKSDNIEKVGGASYLAHLSTYVPTAANVEHHAKMVKDCSVLRSLISTCTKIVEESFNPTASVNELIDNAERLIFEVHQDKLDGGSVHMKDIIRNTIETIEKLYQNKSLLTGLPSGYFKYDELTSGLQPSDLIVVAGRPSMGKSAFVTNICENLLMDHKTPIAFFSLEMSKESLAQRMLCSIAKINAMDVQRGYLSKEKWTPLVNAAAKLSESPFYIDDSPGINVLELRAKARRLKTQYDIQLIVVDYLQLLSGTGKNDSRQQEISDISRSLKALARELRVPVIAISQLNRQVDSRMGNHRPQLSDLRESGAIEQDADVVCFLYREEYYSRENTAEEDKGRSEVIISKQRNGPTGTVYLHFFKEYTRFENPSERETATF
jgi:replicative DNA helicase